MKRRVQESGKIQRRKIAVWVTTTDITLDCSERQKPVGPQADTSVREGSITLNRVNKV